MSCMDTRNGARMLWMPVPFPFPFHRKKCFRVAQFSVVAAARQNSKLPIFWCWWPLQSRALALSCVRLFALRGLKWVQTSTNWWCRTGYLFSAKTLFLQPNVCLMWRPRRYRPRSPFGLSVDCYVALDFKGKRIVFLNCSNSNWAKQSRKRLWEQNGLSMFF